MADFRIDTLIIERNASGTYNHSGVCNSDAGNTQVVNGVYDDVAKETTYSCPANSANNKIEFSVNDIDFSNYTPAEMMPHIFIDAATPAIRKSRGRDKDVIDRFPPPSPNASRGPLNSISDDFTLNKITIQRKAPVSTEDEFTLQLQVSFSSQTTNYTNGSATFENNGYFKIDLVVLEFSSNKDGQSHSGSFTFTVQGSSTLPLKLKDYATDGLPIIIKDVATIWPDVNKKMGLITVD